MRVWHKICMTLDMIKWEHSIIALRFALPRCWQPRADLTPISLSGLLLEEPDTMS
jgi:hypothetical protein